MLQLSGADKKDREIMARGENFEAMLNTPGGQELIKIFCDEYEDATVKRETITPGTPEDFKNWGIIYAIQKISHEIGMDIHKGNLLRAKLLLKIKPNENKKE